MTSPSEETADEQEDPGSDPRETDGRVHFSRLKLMARSAAHYKANPRKDSASFRLGRAVHSYVLGNPDSIVVYEGRRDKRMKVYQEFLAKHPGKTILSPSEMYDVKGMRMAIERNPIAMQLLQGHREQYMQWQLDGHECAGTPDVWRDDGGVTELKTDDDTEPESFQRSAEKYHYHAQVSWYQMALVLGKRIPCVQPGAHCAIVAVESKEPYCVTIIELSPNDLADGRALWRDWLYKLEKAQLFDEWPGYAARPIPWKSKQLRLF